MAEAGFKKYVPKHVQRNVRSSLTYLFLLIAFLTFTVGLYKGGVHLVQLKPEEITLRELPWALTLSFLRMLISYSASLILAFILGLLAARYTVGERIIIPVLDILQSVPVIGFFPAAITFFIGLSSGHRIGVEMAAVFLILTSQAWSMAFSIYESTKTIPQDNLDAVFSFGVSGSQRFWKLFAPASVPRLVYNSMLSWSNGWYFLVACEIISVGPVQYNLPGIGSFLSRAAESDQIHLVLAGLAALCALILTMDVFIWRPLSIWAERFRQDFSSSGESFHHRKRGFFPNLIPERIIDAMAPLQTALKKMVQILSMPVIWILKEVFLPLFWDLPAAISVAVSREVYLRFAVPAMSKWHTLTQRAQWIKLLLFWSFGLSFGVLTATLLVRWLRPPWPPIAREIPLALLASTARIIFTLTLSLLISIPLVLWSWNKPKLRQTLTTISQVGAGLPAVALFPLIFLVAVRRLGGGMEQASLLLLFTGMVWYVMFNGLGGAAIIPPDLSEAVDALGLGRRLTWKRLVLPAIRPALITGALTAWGGGWNALVVSEYVPYKGQVFTVNGIGALLSKSVYQSGDSRAISLCIAAMMGWIVIINTLVWRPLYQSAAERYKFDS